MPASRITFALGDMIEEIKRLRDGAKVEIRLDPETFNRVAAEIAHHHGSAAQAARRDGDAMRGIGRAISYGGMRIVAVLPGDRWGL